MPKVKYSGSEGVVQLTGTDEFLVSGTGLRQEVETVTTVVGAAAIGTATALKPHGITALKIEGGALKHVQVPNPTTVTSDLKLYAGMQKVVYAITRTGGHSAVVNDASGALATLDAAGEYLMLVWTGSNWKIIARNAAA